MDISDSQMGLINFKTGSLTDKSPLKGFSNGVPVWYWFLDRHTYELTSDKILLDEACQLPRELFTLLSMESLINDHCCMYYSREEADKALSMAIARRDRSLIKTT